MMLNFYSFLFLWDSISLSISVSQKKKKVVSPYVLMYVFYYKNKILKSRGQRIFSFILKKEFIMYQIHKKRILSFLGN